MHSAYTPHILPLVPLVDFTEAMMVLNDPYTTHHHEDTAKIAVYIAKDLGIAPELVDKLYIAAKVHDIGKQGIPKTIVSKPSRLLKSELALVKEHVALGVHLLKALGVDADIVRMVSEHHEALDGSGYPHQKHGSQISIGGQILAVADKASALMSKRTYRPAVSVKKTKKILLEATPHQLNEQAVAAAIKYLS